MNSVKVMVIGNQELSSTIIGALLNPLAKDSEPPYCVSVLTYPSQSPYLPSHISLKSVDHRTSDFSSTSLASVFAGQDLVISTIAGGDYDTSIRIIDAAVAAGVRRFIPHEFGQDSLKKGVQDRTPKSAARSKVLKYLRHVSHTHVDFQWVALAVGCVLDSMLVRGDLGFDLQWHSATIHGTGNEHFAATSLERVGIAMASAIRHWDELKNEYSYAAGALVSAKEILAVLERVTTSTWTVGYSDVDDCVREGESRIERGYPDSGMFLMERSILYDQKLMATQAFQYQSANKLLQLESESAESIVRQAYHSFRHRGKPGCGCE